ncbi:MAG: Lrp/AsnC family transcriptional regulator [Crenarchaeota archaeon]|nr:Lrp/AsnC family transcriptional regulator [Thermoproteota archaeon]
MRNHNELDDLDMKILSILMNDARKSVREIARELGVSPATVHNRMKRLQQEGVLKGFMPIVDFPKLGYQVTAIIMVSVEGQRLREFENELKEMKNVIAIYDITGEFDVLVIAKFKDVQALDFFVKDLLEREGIKKTVTHIAFNVVKEDFRVPL